MSKVYALMVFMTMIYSTAGLRRLLPEDPNYEAIGTVLAIGVTEAERKQEALCSFLDERRGFANCNIETPEHDLVRKHLPQNSTVLEFGARYGSTSCEIAAIQKNSGKLVAVEPDSSVWQAYEQNIKAHYCNAHLLKGVVGNRPASKKGRSKDYATRYSFMEVPALSFFDLQKKFDLNFDTLLIDCEGCVQNLLDQNPNMLANIDTILMEGDMGIYNGDKAPDCGMRGGGSSCINYNDVISRLEHEGFSLIETFKEGTATRQDKNDCCPWLHHFALKRTSPKKK